MAFAPTFFSLFGRLHRCHVLQHASRRERLEGGLLHDVGSIARRQSRGAHGGKSPHRRGNCLGNGARSAQGARRGTNRFDSLRCFERYRKCGVLGFSHGAAPTLRRAFQTEGSEHRFHQRQSRGRRGTQGALSRAPLAAYENLRTFAQRWGKKNPSLARLDRERNAAYFTYLRFPENVRRFTRPTGWNVSIAATSAPCSCGERCLLPTRWFISWAL